MSTTSGVMQSILDATRKIHAACIRGGRTAWPAPEQIAEAAIERVLGNSTLRPRDGELDELTCTPVIWEGRP